MKVGPMRTTGEHSKKNRDWRAILGMDLLVKVGLIEIEKDTLKMEI